MKKIPGNCPSSLKKLIESCWDGNPNNRPNFLQIIEKLDDCILEVAIDDVNGRKMWKENFIKDNILITEVSWDKFSEVLANYLKMDLSMKIFQGLKSILVKNEKDKVFVEEFGNLLKWFGPMIDSNSQNFLQTMQNLFTKRWFHGDISGETAESRLAGNAPKTFLIRFSSTPGNYALSKIVENVDHDKILVHIRIIHKPGEGFSFILDGQTYQFLTLDDLIKCPLLDLGSPCSGSKYYVQFRIKQIVTGYIHSSVYS